MALYQLRHRQNLSVRQLARLAGVTYVSIVRIENIRVSPTVHLLTKLARGLKVDIRAFFPSAAQCTSMIVRDGYPPALERWKRGIRARREKKARGRRVTPAPERIRRINLNAALSAPPRAGTEGTVKPIRTTGDSPVSLRDVPSH